MLQRLPDYNCNNNNKKKNMVRKEKIVEIYGNYSLYIIKENYGLRMGEHKPCCILSIHEENEENSFHEIFIDFVR